MIRLKARYLDIFLCLCLKHYNEGWTIQKVCEAVIDKVNEQTKGEEDKISELKEKLSYKEDTLVERKILGLYNFFVKNVKIKYGSIIKRWRDRVRR